MKDSTSYKQTLADSGGLGGAGEGGGGSETPPHSPKDFFNKHQYDVHKYEMLKLGYKTTLLFNKGVKYTTKTHTENNFMLECTQYKG